MEYINCLQREYDNVDKKYSFVEFDISRYAKVSHTINFDEPVTERTAILAAEKYLSHPLDREYFDKVKHDIFPGTKFKGYSLRGDILSSHKFIEDLVIVYRDKKMGFDICCGS